MKRTHYLLIMAFMLANNVFGQKNYVTGGIITPKQDTLRGYINYQEWSQSPTQILFKTEPNSTEQEFSTETLKGFYIDKPREEYLSKTFSIEKLSRQANKTAFGYVANYQNRNKDMQYRTAFVLTLAKGDANLYSFIDADNELHLLIEKQNTLTPLVYHYVIVGSNLVDINEYRNQLRGLLYDCSAISSGLEKLTYKASSITEFIETYNRCFEPKNQKKPVKVVAKGAWELGAMLGVGISTVGFSNLPKAGANKNTSPEVGLFMNYVLARNRGRLAIQNELGYYGYHDQFRDTNYNGTETEYNFNFSYVGLNNLLRYTFYTNKFSVYALLGMSNAFIVKEDNYRRYTNFGLGEKRLLFEDGLRKHEQSVVAGLGLRLNKISLETRIRRGNGFSPYTYVSSDTETMSLYLKYQIK